FFDSSMTSGHQEGNKELTKAQKRALMRRSIGDWVVAYNHQNEVVASGRFVDIDMESGSVSIECFSRYTLNGDWYVKRPDKFVATINIGDVATYADSSRKEVMGLRAKSVYVENLGREIALTIASKDYFGKLSRVGVNTGVLCPYVDTWSNDTLEVNVGKLLIPLANDAFPRPLGQSLTSMVKRLNDRLEKEKLKEKK
ncbi:MAG: hypothetical protein Q7R56_00450, partial [Nanoarchaeota archaeon]|nr:hypothetical protein [Nanoarchaeota archaeon]